MKKLIRAAWTGRFLDKTILCQAFLQYQNTPSARDRLSPVQKLFRHPLQVPYPYTHGPLHQNGNIARKRHIGALSNHRKQPHEGTMPQQGAYQTSGWEHKWWYRTQGQGYGTHMEESWWSFPTESTTSKQPEGELWFTTITFSAGGFQPLCPKEQHMNSGGATANAEEISPLNKTNFQVAGRPYMAIA